MTLSDPPLDGPEFEELLARCREGDSDAQDRLFQLLYRDLHAKARVLMDQQVPMTLQPTALLHEAWIKLHNGLVQLSGVEHFQRLVAKAMRQLLVDHARSRERKKHGGGLRRVQMPTEVEDPTTAEFEILEFHDALDKLGELMPRAAHVVELRVFGQYSPDECATILDTSKRTVMRDWQRARAWLYETLNPHAKSD